MTAATEKPIDLEARVVAAVNRGDWDHALDICQQWVRTQPREADAYYRLAAILLERGRKLPALKASQTSVWLRRDDPKLLTLLAKCYLLADAQAEAREAARRAAALQPRAAEDCDALGVIFTHFGEHEEALRHFQTAVAQGPGNPRFHRNLGDALHFCNDSAAAEAAFDHAITLDPEDYRAHWSLSQLREQSSASNHIERLTGLLDRPGLSETAKAYVSLALSKEYEDLGQYERSFEHLTRGNRIVLRKFPHDEAAESEYFDDLRRIFDASLFGSAAPGFGTSAPIFIIGLPRTGTTLLERILGQHSAVFAAGELRSFGNEFSRMCAGRTGSEWRTNFRNIDFAELGRRYAANVRPRISDARFFTDKHPLNYQLAGAIALALPHATIIHMTRNPMDTCFSNFKQLFQLGSWRCSYDLEAMGRHYLRYRKLMAHWHEVMRGRILDVEYERLVTQPQSSIRNILDRCGLPWEDACLDFHRSTRSVATASAAQVRQAMHSRSIGRWKQHAGSLSGLIKLFREHGVPID